jgi:cytochrome c oxidase assembly protein subunit 15
MYNPALHRYAVLLAVCTLVLVTAGALVTSNQAGLSVPDWPLSYGKIMPDMVGGVLFEHGHRMVATTVGMLTIGMLIWLWRSDQRRWMRNLGLAALGAVILQGVLGGLTVLLLLPPPVSIAHACLAQLFFSTTVALAIFTSRSWLAGPEPVQDYGWPSLRSLSIVTPAAALIQIALGAAFRHRALGVMPHLVGAMIVSLVILITGVFVLNQFPEHKTLRSAAKVMLGILFAQVFLGMLAFWVRLDDSFSQVSMVISTVAHVAGGGLTLASSIALSILIRRNVRAAEKASAEAVVAG